MFQAGDSHVRRLLGATILGVAVTVALAASDPEDVSTEVGVAWAVFAFLAVRSLRHSPVGQEVPGR